MGQDHGGIRPVVVEEKERFGPIRVGHPQSDPRNPPAVELRLGPLEIEVAEELRPLPRPPLCSSAQPARFLRDDLAIRAAPSLRPAPPPMTPLAIAQGDDAVAREPGAVAFSQELLEVLRELGLPFRPPQPDELQEAFEAHGVVADKDHEMIRLVVEFPLLIRVRTFGGADRRT